MIEIRIHGRGGQGAVVASLVLAKAAFKEGKSVQSFPSFGSERRGAPVAAFIRMDQNPVEVRSEIYHPDGIIVLDENLLLLGLADVSLGLKEGGWVLMNSSFPPSHFESLKGFAVTTVDASSVALKHGLGTITAPIVNTAILGALSAATGIVSIDAVVEAIMEEVPVKKDANAQAARDAYAKVKEGA